MRWACVDLIQFCLARLGWFVSSWFVEEVGFVSRKLTVRLGCVRGMVKCVDGWWGKAACSN